MSTPDDCNSMTIARQMTASSPQVSLVDPATASELLASLAELHVTDPASVYWWTSLRCAETFFYGNDATAWGSTFSQKMAEMDGASVFVAITDDEPAPWPVLRIGNKSFLAELVQGLPFFEYMVFQEDGRRLLFDTHDNALIFSSVQPEQRQEIRAGTA